MIGSLSRKGWDNKPFRNKASIPFIGLLILAFSFIVTQGFPDTGCWAASEGAIWEVDPNTSIQDTIDNASFGDRVLVKKGNYHVVESIWMKEGVSLTGAPEDLGAVVISGEPDIDIIVGHSNTLIANLVIQGGEVGIICPSSNDMKSVCNITIEHNLIVKNKVGVLIGADQVSLINNTIAHNEEYGVLIYINPNGPVLHGVGNIVTFNGAYGGMEFYQEDSPGMTYTAFLDLDFVRLHYNDLFDTLYHTWLDSNDVVHHIQIFYLDTFGLCNFSEDPCFVDPNEGDYHLLSYSPCIDRGDPNADYAHEPNPNGGRINLGFYGNTPQATPSLDSDRDGQYDYQEGIGDLDGDGTVDWQDEDTVVIPLAWGGGNLSLHLTASEADPNQAARFEDARMLFCADLPIEPPEGFFPYEAIQLKVSALAAGADAAISISLPDSFTAFEGSHYMALSPGGTWQAIPIDVDPNHTGFTFSIADGQIGDRDGDKNGAIDHLGCLIIPRSDRWEPTKGCFISLTDSDVLNHTDRSHPVGARAALKGGGYFREPLRGYFVALILVPFLFAIPFLLHKEQILEQDNEGDSPSKSPFQPSIPITPLIVMLIILAFLISIGSLARAITFPDMKMNATPNPVGSGARALGVGGAFMAIADDATAASWNPGALLSLKRPEISVVGSFFSGRRAYYSAEEGSIEDFSDDQSHLNYLSLAYPFHLFQRNMVISLNYQHLYEFSQNSHYTWRYLIEDPYLDIPMNASKRQKGSLSTLSPAFAIQIIPSLYFGLTSNFWLDDELDNGWENLNIIEGKDGTVESFGRINTYARLYERYDFSGFNTHIGLLWRINRRLALGGVVKTPFKADIRHTYQSLCVEEYPDNHSSNSYRSSSYTDNLTLKMPVSYGLGISFRFSDRSLMALDIYHTQWGDYLLEYPNGEERSPINNELKEKADISPTTQVRLGAEYLVTYPNHVIPLRCGIFYDPEPATGGVDDFYGGSIGTGLLFQDIALDIAYQYRFGEKIQDEYMLNKQISSDVRQHYLYLSMILYF